MVGTLIPRWLAEQRPEECRWTWMNYGSSDKARKDVLSLQQLAVRWWKDRCWPKVNESSINYDDCLAFYRLVKDSGLLTPKTMANGCWVKLMNMSGNEKHPFTSTLLVTYPYHPSSIIITSPLLMVKSPWLLIISHYYFLIIIIVIDVIVPHYCYQLNCPHQWLYPTIDYIPLLFSCFTHYIIISSYHYIPIVD